MLLGPLQPAFYWFNYTGKHQWLKAACLLKSRKKQKAFSGDFPCCWIIVLSAVAYAAFKNFKLRFSLQLEHSWLQCKEMTWGKDQLDVFIYWFRLTVSCEKFEQNKGLLVIRKFTSRPHRPVVCVWRAHFPFMELCHLFAGFFFILWCWWNILLNAKLEMRQMM